MTEAPHSKTTWDGVLHYHSYVVDDNIVKPSRFHLHHTWWDPMKSCAWCAAKLPLCHHTKVAWLRLQTHIWNARLCIPEGLLMISCRNTIPANILWDALARRSPRYSLKLCWGSFFQEKKEFLAGFLQLGGPEKMNEKGMHNLDGRVPISISNIHICGAWHHSNNKMEWHFWNPSPFESHLMGAVELNFQFEIGQNPEMLSVTHIILWYIHHDWGSRLTGNDSHILHFSLMLVSWFLNKSFNMCVCVSIAF